MASRRNTIGIRIALKVKGTSVDIILMKMPTAGILFHLFGAHSRILWFQHADEARISAVALRVVGRYERDGLPGGGIGRVGLPFSCARHGANSAETMGIEESGNALANSELTVSIWRA
jgi:hypothetical protein